MIMITIFDILLTGYNNGIFISKIYRNNGTNKFTEQESILLLLMHQPSDLGRL